MAESHELIDAQFDRAVEIVQSLPKTGPIQTDYEEKLTMYSLFKQATAGNVKSPRPGIWDMLGRAKWDAWAKHRDLDPYEAKWLYVDALLKLKVLRKYSDKTVAQNLVDELESYGGDPSNIIMSRTLSGSQGSDGSGSTVSADERVAPPRQFIQRPNPAGESSSSEEESEDEARDSVSQTNLAGRASVDSSGPGGRPSSAQYDLSRPESSASSQRRYRTPLAGSSALSPPPQLQSQQARMLPPSQQPLPHFATPSAFADPLPPTPTPANYSRDAQLYAGPGYAADAQRAHLTSPPHLLPSHPSYQPIADGSSSFSRPSSAVALERAIENVQAHLAALQERLETLETRTIAGSHTSGSPRRATTGSPVRGLGLIPGGPVAHEPVWDIDDLGMWSVVLNPMSGALAALRKFTMFFARSENRSPSMVILRRLCLDVSFLLCVVAGIGAIWRKSGVRRREVRAALLILWRAIVGRPHRALMDHDN